MVHFYLYAATPFVHQAVQPNLKQFIVPKWSMRHHNTIVEFIKWSLPLSCSVVVEKLYQTSMTLVKPINIVEDYGERCPPYFIVVIHRGMWYTLDQARGRGYRYPRLKNWSKQVRIYVLNNTSSDLTAEPDLPEWLGTR